METSDKLRSLAADIEQYAYRDDLPDLNAMDQTLREIAKEVDTRLKAAEELIASYELLLDAIEQDNARGRVSVEVLDVAREVDEQHTAYRKDWPADE